MSPFSEYAGLAALAIAIVTAIPRLIAIWTKKGQLDTRGEIDRFEATLAAQDKLLVRCHENGVRLEAELEQERTERVREREYFYQQITAANKRLSECEGILTRRGWQESRTNRREPGGEKTG